MQLTDKFTFGKHRGRTLKYILEEYPSYVEWCLHNVKGFTMDKNAYYYRDVLFEVGGSNGDAAHDSIMEQGYMYGY